MSVAKPGKKSKKAKTMPGEQLAGQHLVIHPGASSAMGIPGMPMFHGMPGGMFMPPGNFSSQGSVPQVAGQAESETSGDEEPAGQVSAEKRAKKKKTYKKTKNKRGNSWKKTVFKLLSQDVFIANPSGGLHKSEVPQKHAP